MNCSLPDSSVYGILQARILEWVAISFSRGSYQTRDWTWVSCIVDGCFIIWVTREVNVPLVSLIFLKTSLVFPSLLFSSIFCTDLWGRLSYLSLLFFWTLHSPGSIFPFFLLSFTFLLFTAICQASSDSHFAFFAFLFHGDGLDPCLLYNVTNLHR